MKRYSSAPTGMSCIGTSTGFSPRARKILSEAEDPARLSYPEFIQAEVRTYQKILRGLIREAVEKHSIRRFYFLGDLVFGLNKEKRGDKKTGIAQ